jgi:long-chain acyl-CoA synthetase
MSAVSADPGQSGAVAAPAALGAHAMAAQYPDKCAIVGPDGSRVTFGELGATANRIANTLRALGLRPGDTVASVQHNGIAHFEVLLAATQIGLYLVPVNVHLTPPEVAYILADCGAKAVVASSDLAATLAPARESLPGHRFSVGGTTPGWLDYSALHDRGSARPPAERAAGLLMGYTSGTSGRPKGVQRPLPPVTPEQTAMGTSRFLAQFGFRPREGVHLVCAPLYHSAPGTFSLNLLNIGHTIVVQERFNAEAVLSAIAEYRVTSTHLVPTHVHRLLALPPEIRTGCDLSSLETVLVAGAPFPVRAKQELLAWLGPVVWEYLGATEGIVCVVSPQEALTHPGTVGRPAAVKLLDDDGREVPAGEPGTVWFPAGPGSFVYRGDAEKTAATVSPDGFATAGDIGRLDDDGYLYLLDRRSDLIISGGVNIYPAEVEQQLLTHEAVADAAVVGVPDPEWGASVAAVVVLRAGYEPSDAMAAALGAHCRDGIAKQKCPRRFEFRAELPRTPTGKLLRRVVRDELAR